MMGQTWRDGQRGLIAGAAHDVFVSYSRHNNASYDDGHEGWVSRVVRILRVALAEKLGRSDTRVWFDLESREVRRLDDAISTHVSGSALFLFVLSRASLTSQTCIGEFDSFLSAHAHDFMERLVVIDMDNAFGSPVFLEDLLTENRPDDAALRRVLGECRRQIRIECFRNIDDGRVCALDHPPESPNSPARYLLYQKITDVAVAIANKLTALRRRERASGPAQLAPQGGISGDSESPVRRGSVIQRIPVFLGLARASSRERRDELVRYLSQHSEVELRPPIPTKLWPDTVTSEAFRQILEPLLASSLLFILLLSERRTQVTSISSDYIVDATDLPPDLFGLQLESAERLHVKPLVWCSPEIHDNDLDIIEVGIRRSRSVIEDGFESFKRMLDAQIARCKQAQLQLSAKVNNSKQVFFNFAVEDRSFADPLIARYQERYTLLTPAQGASPAETRELNDEFYRSCDAVVLLDCNAPPRWMDAQLMQFTKVRSSRTTPIRTLAAVRSEARRMLAVRVPGLQMIDIIPGQNAAAISPVLDRLFAQLA